MYSTIFELPTQVRNSLSEEDQNKFLTAYNEQDPKSENEMRHAMRYAWHSCKELPSSFSFHIIASVETPDKEGEIVDLDSLKERMDDFIDRGGVVQYDHGDYNVGSIWDWEPTEVEQGPAISVWGNVFGGNDVYDTVRKLFVDGGANNLSVAGVGKPVYTCDEKGCYTRRDVKNLMEISLCKSPTNPYATMLWYNDKADFAKSRHGDMALRVDTYTIHKDETTCPILGLRKSLRAAGLSEAHATADGVEVPMTWEEFEKALPAIISAGLHVDWTGSAALLNDWNAYAKRRFVEIFNRGYTDETGMISKSIPKDLFVDLYDEAVIEPYEDGYRFVVR